VNREKARLLQFKLVLLDGVSSGVAFLLAYWVRSTLLSARFGEIYPLARYSGVLAIAVVSLPVLFMLLKVYETDGSVLARKTPLGRDLDKLNRLFRGVALEYVLLSAIVFSLKLHYLSRLLIGLFVGLDFVLLGIARVGLWPQLYRRANRKPVRVLIVGSGSKARELARTLTETPHVGTAFLGFVVDKGAVLDSLDGHPILGGLEELDKMIDRYVVDEVLLALPHATATDLDPILLMCEQRGVTARLAFDVAPLGAARLYLERLGDVPLLTFSTVPNNSYLLAVKRVIDAVLSSLLVILTLPIFVIVAVLIKITTKGSVFYKQVRCGLNGRKFTFYKFRSMVKGADEQRDEVAHLNEAKGPIFKISTDPRVTPVGRFLRKTSIDELPQLFNVLKGEMSLVGPRPPLPKEVKLYETWQRRRMSVKPGLTCLWQVSGRSSLSFDEWVAMDLRYIDNWSLGQDFRILLRTIPAVLTRRGAW
jgi:exopolysaccharide biosynthesis polyprenyl glycosylphosphotransferase